MIRRFLVLVGSFFLFTAADEGTPFGCTGARAFAGRTGVQYRFPRVSSTASLEPIAEVTLRLSSENDGRGGSDGADGSDASGGSDGGGGGDARDDGDEEDDDDEDEDDDDEDDDDRVTAKSLRVHEVG